MRKSPHAHFSLPVETLSVLALVVVVLIGSVSLNSYNSQRLRQDSLIVDHTHQVLHTLEGILSQIKDAETGQRGYLITGQHSYLEPYEGSREKVASLMTRLTELTVDNPAAQARFPNLQTRINERFELLADALRVRREEGFQAASDIIASNRGKDSMDLLRGEIGEFVAAENVLLAQRAATSKQTYQTVMTTGLLTGILGLGLVTAYGLLSHRMLHQRARSAATLFQERELLSITLSSIGDGVITTDVGGQVTFLNPVAQELCGWTNEQAGGQPLETVFQIVNETTRNIVENPALRALAEGTIVGLANHTILISQNGSERAIADSAAPIRGIDGKLLGSVLVFRDVTVDRGQETALRSSEAMNKAILEAALDAIITCDHTGQIVEFNPAAERIFGYCKADVLGRKLADAIVPPSLRGRHELGMARYMKTGEPVILNQRVELEALHASGRVFPVEFAVTVIRGDGPPKFTAYLQDITERKAAERTLDERMRLLALTAEVSRAVATADGPPEMLQSSAEALVKNLQVASAQIWVLDEAARALEQQGNAGLDQQLHRPPDRISIDQFLIGRIAEERQPFLTNTLAEHTQFPEHEWAKKEGLVALAGYPLLIGSQLIGVMSIFAREPLEPQTLDVMKSIAEKLAIGIDRQRALRSEQESRRQWQVTLASIGDAVLTTDMEGRVTFLNAVARELTGWTLEDAIGQPTENVFNIINEQTEEPVVNPVRRVLAEGIIVGLANHTILIAKDGSRRPIDDSGAPIRSGEAMSGVVLVFRDVSEQKRAELQLREREAELRHLADAMPQIVWVARPDGYLESYNQQWYDYTGCTPEQCLGHHENLWIHPDDRARSQTRWNESLATGENFEVERRVRSKSGEYRWFLGRALPVHDDAGKILKWFGTSTDITERKHLEDHLREVAADLSEANRRKNEFLATLAHELRNPLAPIRTGLEVIKHAAGDPQMIEQTRSMMERQTGQMVRLIDDLLDVSRITLGKLQLRKTRIQLTDVIKSSVEATQPFIDEAGHELRVSLPETPIYLLADPHRLAQVYSNLLSNASKYTPERGTIQLDAWREGDFAVVRVRDTGLGIPPEMQSRIFEMFAQIDRPIEQGYTGLGIGLTLVKRLVEMHDGQIDVHSQGTGHGSEFSVRLPVSTESPVEESSSGMTTREPDKARMYRILVVDDNKAAAETLRMVLKILGHEVFMAHDGLEGVSAAEQHRPEVILMDLGMPKLNGFEAARKIREQAWGGEVFLIALTGWGQDEDKQHTREAGFDHHLTKPADPAALQVLLNHLERKP